MDHLADVKAFYRQHVEPSVGPPLGSRAEQVDQLEADVGFTLPAAYKQYLLWMGSDVNGVFRGSCWHIDTALSNGDSLRSLLDENDASDLLPDRFLAFYTHQGYQAAWFRLPRVSEDPEVYLFFEGDHPPFQRRNNFTEFLMEQMAMIAEVLPSIHTRRQSK